MVRNAVSRRLESRRGKRRDSGAGRFGLRLLSVRAAFA